ncbi:MULTISPECIES: hypothetical protein [Halomonas]|uniref:Uncharacterized protein n=1 Tax=Halomonas halophila TaxID=29573 RepID=A0ABQ0UB20_9GAMM|nr:MULTISPECIES: hypothetical protein [Halomonas]MDR5891128.1 hypothetical protein [Halomonas salina]PSJ22154.1 hypothetical protein CVH10_08775 [Halomonas sp. ND22Bw]WJY08408.1 hypothetical protein QWG60_05705 [Halomonas halophila]GEK74209.1 hypothetical protein HHA04nite_27530 [Halomonas halophila]
MPEETLPIDDQMEELLDQVRHQEGLENNAQAAEFLLRRRLRKGVQGLTGRGRALYPINPRGGRR